MVKTPKHHTEAEHERHARHGEAHNDAAERPDALGVPKSEQHAIAEGLAAIYGEERGDLSKLERGGSRLTRMLVRVVALLTVLALASFGGFFAYTKYFSASGTPPLTLSVDALAEVTSGTAQRVVVRYGNAGRVPLASLTIDLNVPPAFHVTTMTPEPTDGEEYLWTIGTLPEKSDGEIVLEGTWFAEAPSTTTVQALATYRPANFNADFDQAATASVTTTGSALALVLTGPERVTSGEEATYTATLENTGGEAFPGVGFAVTLPDGFLLTSSTPALPAGAGPEWIIGDIAPQAVYTVTIRGTFSADVTDVQQLAATLFTRNDVTELTQAEATVFTDVVGNGLSLQLVANGSTDDVALDPGEPLRVTIGYTNTSEAVLANVALLVDFQSPDRIPIDWQAATLDGGKLTAEGIAFGATVVGALPANEKATRNLIFPVQDEVTASDAQSWDVVLHATVGGVSVQSQPLTIHLNSDAEFTAQARYYSEGGAPLGDGPLPPTVGEETTYQLSWTISNSLHSLEDVRVSATLPPGVVWTNSADASTGGVAYDEGTRTVTWTITDIPADAGEATVTMDVAITPEESDIGRFVKLLSASAFRATDTVTGATLQQTGDVLTTECEGDTLVEGKGTVEE